LNKVREELLADGDEGELIFDKFIKALIDSEDVLETDAGIKELYTKVSELFRGRSDLLDPFVSFLQPGEALTCGKAMENIEMGNMTDFLIKAEVHFFLYKLI
jgi:histone deacetylase complex regulatory component SIN3